MRIELLYTTIFSFALSYLENAFLCSTEKMSRPLHSATVTLHIGKTSPY